MDILKGVSGDDIGGCCENESSDIISYYMIPYVISAYFLGPSDNKDRHPNRKIEVPVTFNVYDSTARWTLMRFMM